MQDDSTDNLDETADTDRVDDTDEDKPLGPTGERAYQAEKEKRRAATTRAREAEEERDRLKAELAKLRNGGDDTDKVDADAIRKQARAEARAESLTERAMDKVEARAAKLFADPEDARALLAAKAKTFVDDDEIDVDAIDAALKELLTKKPHLAATAKRFAGGADGGARKGSSVSQLTEQDLKRMTPQQIVDAQTKGQLNDLLGVF